MAGSNVLCDFLCFHMDIVDFDNDKPILLEDFQEKESELCIDDFDLDITDVPGANDVSLNEIPQIVFVSEDDVLVAIHEPVLPSTSTYRFTCEKCKEGCKKKTNFENHCQNLCRKSK